MEAQGTDYLRRLQAEMQGQGRNAEEIARCVQYAKRLLSAGLPVLFDRTHVRQALELWKVQWESYHVFSISQGEKIREITAPSKALKIRQRWILDEILSKMDVSPYAQGFEKAHSIKTNAMLHAQHDYVVCLDIKDFFPSIFSPSVQKAFRDAGYTTSAAKALADLCCYQDALPQGAPTSPRLSNIVCKEMDAQLAEIAKEYGAVYSRYADDMTFSGNQPLAGISQKISGPFRRMGFTLNSEKTRLYGPGQPKEITGLIVQNGVVRVPKFYRRQLKQEIYYCRKFGVLCHLENRKAQHYIHYRDYLYGKAYYVKMIEPELGECFLSELDQIEWPAYCL